MEKPKIVSFTFNDASRTTLEEMTTGVRSDKFIEITVTDPTTGEPIKVFIPKLACGDTSSLFNCFD